MAPWDRAWLSGGRGRVRTVTAGQAGGHPSWEGADFLKDPIPTVQVGRLRPREESETPKVLGVAEIPLIHKLWPKMNIPRHWALPGQEAAVDELD